MNEVNAFIRLVVCMCGLLTKIQKMENEIGIELTEKEIKLVKSLERLAKRWKVDGKNLWLFSGSGSLYVMLKGDTQRNPECEMLPNHGVNPKNIVTKIQGITNDGGDW